MPVVDVADNGRTFMPVANVADKGWMVGLSNITAVVVCYFFICCLGFKGG